MIKLLHFLCLTTNVLTGLFNTFVVVRKRSTFLLLFMCHTFCCSCWRSTRMRTKL